jgi:hypothetical protein
LLCEPKKLVKIENLLKKWAHCHSVTIVSCTTGSSARGMRKLVIQLSSDLVVPRWRSELDSVLLLAAGLLRLNTKKQRRGI